MKYGIVVYKNTWNIGDDIQSYAAARLLPSVDYYIDRESIDSFKPEGNEIVNTIVNGWFMYNKTAWPVSPYINPLYISLHFKQNDCLEIGGDFLEGLGGDDLRKHEPVGCRDMATLRLLNKYGISGWFSGCLTLTLDSEFETRKGGYICLTDVSDELVNYVKTQYPSKEIKIIHHVEKTLSNLAIDERFNNVKELLTVYQNADAVVTSRLHCALPCLALQTPTLLVLRPDIEEKDRFDGIDKYLYYAYEQEYMSGKVKFDLNSPPFNKPDYISLREKLKNSVNTFIDRVNNSRLKIDSELCIEEWEKRIEWKNNLVNKSIDRINNKWQQNKDWINKLNIAKEWLEEQLKYKMEEIENKDKEIEHLMEGKKWLEKHSKDQEKYIQELLEERKKLFEGN